MWIVHKFGGTSVGNADSMLECIKIIRPLTETDRVAVVVSAMGGKPKTTDLLLDLVHAAAAGRTEEIQSKTTLIREKHSRCVNQLLGGKQTEEIASNIMAAISKDLQDISDLLRAVQLMRTAHEQILELVSGYGEVWSASILVEVLRQQGLPFVFLNARDVLFVSEIEGSGTNVHWDESEQKLGQFIDESAKTFAESSFGQTFKGSSTPVPHLLITGYIASTLSGTATTLKRDGSDFSASIFGRLLRATSITIWTDVSGVFSADPRRVPDAQVIPYVSYTEAVELAYFGAKVIHPKTMSPAIMSQIPIFIRNTFSPEEKGTRIFLSTLTEKSTRETTVCGFTTIDNIALLNIGGTGIIGVPGIAHRLFGALKAANISVMFIAQASSEHSVCFATKEESAERAKRAIQEAFFYEYNNNLISDFRVITGCSIIAAVGESMGDTPGVSGLFFGALGTAKINILSIAQGCDECNISAVVYTKDSTRALRAVHSAFWLSSMEISIGIVGTGRVGSALLQILLTQAKIIGNRFGFNLRIRGVANSRKMLMGEDITDQLKNKVNSFQNLGLQSSRKSRSNVSLEDLEKVMADDQDDKVPTDLEAFYQHVRSGPTPHTIIIDASNGDDVAKRHPAWLMGGVHIVTANKRALSSSLELYDAVFTAARSMNRMYLSEVTIGASLPIRTTLADILCSGDAVHSIVGLMSVSVGVVLTDVCENGLSFTESLVKTYDTGLFEDDVFVDLDGSESASKLLILARELGVSMKLEDIIVEPLASRRTVTSWKALGDTFKAEDVSIAERAQAAAEKGCTLRYVQRIECTPPAELGGAKPTAKAWVRLEEVPLDSELARIKGAVYHFAFHTERYDQNPLVVQGPLSDSANTASGILGDMLRIARSIGAKDKGPEALST